MRLFPYDDADLSALGRMPRRRCDRLWPYRTLLGDRDDVRQRPTSTSGLPWWEWHQVASTSSATPLSITFAFVATHNHFVLDRGGKVFKQIGAGHQAAGRQPARTITSRCSGCSTRSMACFWMKQVCHNKGGTVDQRGGIATTKPGRTSTSSHGTKLD